MPIPAMTIRRLSILLTVIAIGLAGVSIYIKPDTTALTCINPGQSAEIISACTALIEDPDTTAEDLPVFLYKRAWAARRIDDFELAMADINRAVDLRPDSPLIWVNRAFINNAKGAVDAADADFERALALEPGSLFTIMDRAVIYTGRGDYTGALNDYFRALEIDPNSKRAMNGIIRSYENLAQYDSALEWLTKAAEQWPDDARFPTGLGAIHYYISKDYLAALADFETVEKINPDYIANRLMLGATHLKLGHLEIGKTYVEQQAAQLVQSMETEGSLFARALIISANATQLAGNTELFFQGVSYALINQPELSRTAFHRYLESGGRNAVRILRGLLAGHFECTRPDCGGPEDEEYEAALTRYIMATSETLLLKYN